MVEMLWGSLRPSEGPHLIANSRLAERMIMASRNRTERALSILLRAGVLGASAALATAQANSPTAAQSATAATPDSSPDVAQRLQTIREAAESSDVGAALFVDPDEKTLLAQWVNFSIGSPSWRNGGWNNGGWRNAAGWRNGPWGAPGWRNAGPWRNSPWVAPWNNWRNGPWNNFWRNW
jgi:rSAM-associated Gly-rich repeat protein